MNLFVRFAAAGAVGTGVHYLILIVLVSGMAVNPAWAAMWGALCGAVVNYVLNHHYNFGGSHSHREAAPRFSVMVVLGVALNGTLVHLLSGAGVNYLVSQALATLVILLFNFFVCKTWIFAKNN
jgi:putative flippase GtrA